MKSLEVALWNDRQGVLRDHDDRLFDDPANNFVLIKVKRELGFPILWNNIPMCVRRECLDEAEWDDE